MTCPLARPRVRVLHVYDLTYGDPTMKTIDPNAAPAPLTPDDQTRMVETLSASFNPKPRS